MMDVREANQGLGEPMERATTGVERSSRAASDTRAVIDACVQETEALFRSGTHHCAEAVVTVIRKHFTPDVPEQVVRLVRGLGSGCNVGCICGALSGATIALGMALPEDEERVQQLTRAIHEWFTKTYRTSCCRALQNKREEGCRVHPGAVAGKIAELLLGLEKASGE